jgi:hypothetical protein
LKCRAGDVKDFVKDIQREDMRIDIRKKNLSRTAERLARTRASNPSSQPPLTPSLMAEHVSSETLSTPTPVRPSVVSSPIHPSLPPKPGSSPRVPTLSQESNKVASPVPTPARAPSPQAKSIPTPPDDQILKFEEVCCVSLLHLDAPLS